MRLVYLSASKIPSREANSIHVMKMCQAFGHLGHEVTLLAPDVTVGLKSSVSDIYAFYGVDRCFELRKVPWRPIRGRGWIYGWEAGRLASRLGVDAAFGRSLHACAIAVHLGMPTTWDAHMLTFLKRWDEYRLFRWMIDAPAFRQLSVNCASLGRCILERVPELEGRIVVAHNGADIWRKTLRLPTLGEGRDRKLAMWATSTREKVSKLSRLSLPEFRPPTSMSLAASGYTLRRSAPIPQSLKMSYCMVSCPQRRPSDCAWPSTCCSPPYQSEVRIAGGGETAAWMSPLKIFGYMAAAKPILCSDLPVLREVIEDGRNGLLLRPDDPDAWAAALQRLLGDRSLREQLGAAAHADFLARHTWRQRATRVLDAAHNHI